jgi:hypothetical protein
MKCEKCEKEYASKYYFVVNSLCRECFELLTQQEQDELLAGVESLSTEGASKRIVDGHELHCPICAHDEFWKRHTLMNTPGLTFLGVEWANRQAENYVCDSCGYILWFLRESLEHGGS